MLTPGSARRPRSPGREGFSPRAGKTTATAALLHQFGPRSRRSAGAARRACSGRPAAPVRQRQQDCLPRQGLHRRIRGRSRGQQPRDRDHHPVPTDTADPVIMRYASPAEAQGALSACCFTPAESPPRRRAPGLGQRVEYAGRRLARAGWPGRCRMLFQPGDGSSRRTRHLQPSPSVPSDSLRESWMTFGQHFSTYVPNNVIPELAARDPRTRSWPLCDQNADVELSTRFNDTIGSACRRQQATRHRGNV